VPAYNRVEWAEIYAAVAEAGLVTVPIDFRPTEREVAYIVPDGTAAALLVEDAPLATVERARGEPTVPAGRLVHFGEPLTPAGYYGYEDLLATATDREPDVVVLPDDPWCLMYTSGTTANPKGAIRSHRGMAMLAMMTEVEFRLHRRDNGLLVMPMCHANSLNFFSAFSYCGAVVTIFSRAGFDPEECLRTLGRATFSSLVPTHYAMMPDLPATKHAIMAMFPNSGLYELYGSTEAGWVTILHPDEQFDHLGTVGREVVGSAPIRLLDDDGNEVPDGEPGESFSCSPYRFDGYWKLPQKTADAMRGQYLSVGDVALRDADGFIRLIDRKKNLIVSGGENICPAEVEQVPMAHPDVRDCAVIGVSDPKWSERVVAVVGEGADLSARSLIDRSRDRLAGFKRPRQVVFLSPDQMPRNATGKIPHREPCALLNRNAPVS